jgi:hypothetical protein
MLALSMDREILLEHLEHAERRVADGERQVARQRHLIAELERDGLGDLCRAGELLAQFELAVELHRRDRDRIKRDLAT